MDQISNEDYVKPIEEKRESSKPEFSEQEVDLISRMYNLVGEKWSLIAGRIPGRTAEEIEKYWKMKNHCNSSSSIGDKK